MPLHGPLASGDDQADAANQRITDALSITPLPFVTILGSKLESFPRGGTGGGGVDDQHRAQVEQVVLVGPG
jgi:hypothetical protein